MASDYGLNFGFRRSDETVSVREGRFKTPVASTLKQGTMVEIDPASAGYLKASATNVATVTGFHGLLVQEEVHIRSVYEQSGTDSYDLTVTRANKLSVIWSGSGVKFWLQNTASVTRADGRVTAAVTMVDLTTGTPAVGDTLSWTGTVFTKTGNSGTSNVVARITAISGTTYCEAVLIN